MFLQTFGQGMVPSGMTLGQFWPTQNLQDTQRAREFEQGQLGAVSGIGMAAAQQSLQELIHGYAGSQGGGLVGMGLLSSEEGNKMSELLQSDKFGAAVAAITPLVGNFMPGGTMDALGLGANQAAGNYSELFRNQMQTPGQPGTGMTPGQLTGAATQLTGAAQQNLYSHPQGSLAATRGFGLGQLSSFVAPAMQRGLGPGNIDYQTQAGRKDFTDWQAGLAKPMSAIRDLGGGYSAMNADQMAQTLDQLNMGGFSRGVNNEQLEQQTRMFKQLSRQADISYGEAAGLQQFGGAASVAKGGDAMSGVMAGQHGMAFGAYAKSQGAGFIQAAGGISANEMMQQDTQLMAQAGRSETANNAAALLRMGDKGMLRDGSPAHKAYIKLKEEGEFNLYDAAAFRKTLEKSGVDMTVATGIIHQRDENKDLYGDKVAGAVRETQWDADIAPLMRRTVANQMSGVLRQRGKRTSARRMWKAGEIVTSTVREMAGASREEVIEAIAERLEEAGLGGRNAEATAELALGAASRAARSLNYRGGAGHAAAMHSKRALEETHKEQDKAQGRVDDEIEHAADGQRNFVGRAAHAVKSGVKTPEEAAAFAAGATEVSNDRAAARQVDEQESGTDAAQDLPGERAGATAVDTDALSFSFGDGDSQTIAGMMNGVSEQPGDTGGIA